MAEMPNGNGNEKKNGNGRPGFLPIHTNTFDRVFIGTVLFVALHLFWMRFLEAHIPLFFATILSLLIGGIIVARG
jgi:predicted small integral membrane protein